MLHDRPHPLGAAVDHLPAALGTRRSLPRPLSGVTT
jgi:hypothetical protein